MTNYADDCSPYEYSCSIDDIQKLQNDSQCLLKLKPVKWHLPLSEKNEEFIYNSTDEHFLGVFC